MVFCKRILVVDDSKLARMALRALLNDLGVTAEVTEAADAETALELSERSCYDTVFMDYNMPGVDGLSAAAVIRARQPDAAIALVTANAQDDILAEARRLRVAFLGKPVRRDDIARFIAAAGHIADMGVAEKV
ncbi:CheY-like chemotaxis protein [Azospirillum fermentarium]|uniref:response regulator n=1 Tax=Azospirillum fermentarium TaxID=1233114 RepID=UPI002226017B|nr:response regulator [Azospirillum fermentarium]MCW2248635.1 CheY-like chemotaxis protein [Azospirillum fermentarium]